MKILDFFKKYPDEESCKLAFKSQREQQGIVCKKCTGRKHYWLKSKELYQCKSCGFRMSLKSGTLLENSKLPYQYWFVAIHLMTATKKSISALEMKSQLGHRYYEPIWAMMHKIRRVLSERDNTYKLDGEVELDEGFYSISFSFGIDEFSGVKETLKRGKGSQKKAKVLVMASFNKVPISEFKFKKYKTPRSLKYIKMKVIEDLESETIKQVVQKSIDKDSTVHTDGYKSYNKLPEIIKTHCSYNLKHDNSNAVLPWVHKAITNSKNLVKAIHHCVSSEYLQNYLDEFCYKHNRRNFTNRVFERAIIAAVTLTWY
jgi:transposase-like protein